MGTQNFDPDWAKNRPMCECAKPIRELFPFTYLCHSCKKTIPAEETRR